MDTMDHTVADDAGDDESQCGGTAGGQGQQLYVSML